MVATTTALYCIVKRIEKGSADLPLSKENTGSFWK